ncbi:hypothetical protein H4R33_006187, partial [Dimargaris cristalligena]
GDIVFSFLIGTGAYLLYERDHPREDGRTLFAMARRHWFPKAEESTPTTNV